MNEDQKTSSPNTHTVTHTQYSWNSVCHCCRSKLWIDLGGGASFCGVLNVHRACGLDCLFGVLHGWEWLAYPCVLKLHLNNQSINQSNDPSINRYFPYLLSLWVLICGRYLCFLRYHSFGNSRMSCVILCCKYIQGYPFHSLVHRALLCPMVQA